MRVSPKTKEAISRGSVRVIKDVLTEEIESCVSNLKICKEYELMRYFQGKINALEDTLALFKK